MRYLSVCSGIEAATVAWHPLGWQAAAYAEIDPHASCVLHHHYGATRPLFMPDPNAEGLSAKDRKARLLDIENVQHLPLVGDIRNLGDMTQFKDWPDDTIDLLVGGAPCQSFSIAGLREGLADPRGNLMLTYGAIAGRYRPRWLVWENVPGVLSSNKGRDFGAFLWLLGQLGYGWAYRVLDAQHVRTLGHLTAVPQRRRRVFVVAYLGDWRRAAAVLFDRESLRGDPAPRRLSGQDIAGTLDAGLGKRGQPEGERGHLIPEVTGALTSGMAASANRDPSEQGALIPEVANPLTARMHKGVNTTMDEGQTMVAQPVAPGLTRNPYGDHESRDGLLVAHSLRGEGFDASEDGSGRGIPLLPIAIQERAGSEKHSAGPDGAGVRTDGVAYTLEARRDVQAVAFDATAGGETGFAVDAEVAGALRSGDKTNGHAAVAWSIMPQNSGKDFTAKPTDVAQPLTAGSPDRGQQGGDLIQAVAFDMRGREGGAQMEGPHDTANIRASHGGASRSFVAQLFAVRRLMPVECERLQGFRDGYTDVPWRGRPGSPDGKRYKDIGNSMATNVMEFIGERINQVEALINE